jgi:hypothetical protein
LRSTEYKSPVVDGRLQAASDGIGLKREGAMTVSYPIVTTASQLSDEIKEVDVASQADGGNGTHYSITLKAGATLTKARTSPRSTSPAKTRSPSTAGAAVLDGGSAYRGLFAWSKAINRFSVYV